MAAPPRLAGIDAAACQGTERSRNVLSDKWLQYFRPVPLEGSGCRLPRMSFLAVYSHKAATGGSRPEGRPDATAARAPPQKLGCSNRLGGQCVDARGLVIPVFRGYSGKLQPGRSSG